MLLRALLGQWEEEFALALGAFYRSLLRGVIA
jgi:hypothetical protein